jgi:peptide/nickel transport system substrate-binding protein
MKKVMKIAVLILTALLLLGCTGKEEVKVTPTPGAEATTTGIEQVLKVGAVKDFKKATEGRSLVFETLVDVDRQGNPVPLLAESWDASDDGLVYTIRLRDGIKFHDGTPFDAKAAKFALEWSMNNGAPYGKYVDGVDVVDDHTIKVRFKEYYYPFLIDLASEFRSKIVSPTAVNPAWDTGGKLEKFIGTGPFKLVEYVKDQYAVLERNDDYWGTKPKLEKVIWKTIPDPHALVMALKTGDVDIIGAPEHHSAVPYEEVPKLQAEKDIKVTWQSYGRFQVIRFNCFVEPLDDIRVRKAINYVVDRETMVKELFAGIAEPANLPMCPWFKYGPAGIKGYEYDPEKAKALLEEAGWIDTDGNGIREKDGKELAIDLLIPQGEANADAVAVYLQSELKKVGIKLNIISMESSAAWAKKKEGEYMMFVHHSGCIPWAPQGVLWQEHYTKAGQFKHYHSDELDTLIEKVYSTTDDTKRDEYYQQIWRILNDEAAQLPLYDIVKVVAYRDCVKGYEHSPTMYKMNLMNVEIVEQ